MIYLLACVCIQNKVCSFTPNEDPSEIDGEWGEKMILERLIPKRQTDKADRNAWFCNRGNDFVYRPPRAKKNASIGSGRVACGGMRKEPSGKWKSAGGVRKGP